MKRVVALHQGAVQPLAAGPDPRRECADPDFSASVIHWQKQHGRHTLPWQNTRDGYRVWLSEIMLQQTQVAAVIPYYQRFLLRFPDLESLAAAPSEDVMGLWSGLGYYSRARNLHRCAQRIVAEHGGVLPSDAQLLADLPGIGRSTAAAIAAFCYGARAAILDGNVKRVFARVFGVEGYPGERRIEESLWLRAQALLPQQEVEAYTQGLMDLGATLCTRSKPACEKCPLAQRCVALTTHRTHELPVRKPKKIIPEKQTAMLILIDRNQVLLQQRPNMGIWGGLLSLPEVELPAAASPAQVAAVVAQAVAPFGIAAAWECLPRFAHKFTHFTLHISPYRVRLERRLDMAAQFEHSWVDAGTLAQAPLPAPVKKMLLEIFAAGAHPRPT